ncbi:GNAT family N-acetyltransferase, partial [Kocuria tytonis]
DGLEAPLQGGVLLDVLAVFVQRGAAEMADAPEVAHVGPLLAAVFPARRRGFVTYAPFSMGESELDDLIARVVSRFTADPRVDHVAWKTRSHDHLPFLVDKLQHHGFVLEEPETVMAGEADVLISAAAGPEQLRGYTVERAVTEASLREAENLAGRVFGDSLERIRLQEDELVERWRSAPESFEMWVVRDEDGHVACSGRSEFPERTDFAGLWGGACLEGHRGCGLYRALVVQRARSARHRGRTLIHVDCSEYSRPILERAGLLPITTVRSATRACP